MCRRRTLDVRRLDEKMLVRVHVHCFARSSRLARSARLGCVQRRSRRSRAWGWERGRDGDRMLTVDGVVVASSMRLNASARNEFEIEFSVRVLRNNQLVSNGAVTI